jgi:hypothetical protein
MDQDWQLLTVVEPRGRGIRHAVDVEALSDAGGDRILVEDMHTGGKNVTEVQTACGRTFDQTDPGWPGAGQPWFDRAMLSEVSCRSCRTAL